MGTIKFVPETGRPLSGKINPDGSFKLSKRSLSSSRLSDGALPGIYRVSVSAAKVINEDADQVEWLAPSQYADFRTSGIEMEIESPRDDLVVELTSDVSACLAEDELHLNDSMLDTQHHKPEANKE